MKAGCCRKALNSRIIVSRNSSISRGGVEKTLSFMSPHKKSHMASSPVSVVAIQHHELTQWSTRLFLNTSMRRSLTAIRRWAGAPYWAYQRPRNLPSQCWLLKCSARELWEYKFIEHSKIGISIYIPIEKVRPNNQTIAAYCCPHCQVYTRIASFKIKCRCPLGAFGVHFACWLRHSSQTMLRLQ